MATVELAIVDGLKKCVHMLVEGDGVKVDVPLAMRNIDTFIGRIGEQRKGGIRLNESATGLKLLKTLQIYKGILTRIGFRENAVLRFMKVLCISVHFQSVVRVEKFLSWLRRVFIQAKFYPTISQLANSLSSQQSG